MGTTFRVGPTTLGVAAAVVFTCPLLRMRLSYLSLSNLTGGAVTGTVYIVPSGGTASGSNAFLSAASVPANDQIAPTVDIPLDPGDTIQALASAITSLNLFATVKERTGDD